MPPLRIGDCFRHAFEGDLDEHRWVVCTKPLPFYQNKSLTVSLTTLRSFSDRTVVFNRGDHSSLTKDQTVVSYRDARLEDLKAIETAIEAEEIVQLDRFRRDQIIIIQNGIVLSPETDRKVIKPTFLEARDRGFAHF